LAEKLSKTIKEIETIPYNEFVQWLAYFETKHDIMKKQEKHYERQNRK
jgi:hypothetical protein